MGALFFGAPSMLFFAYKEGKMYRKYFATSPEEAKEQYLRQNPGAKVGKTVTISVDMYDALEGAYDEEIEMVKSQFRAPGTVYCGDLGIRSWIIRTAVKMDPAAGGAPERRSFWCLRVPGEAEPRLRFRKQQGALASARHAAQEIALREGRDVSITSEYILVDGNEEVERFGIEDTTVYEKPELTEGSVILEEHAYVFV